MGMRAHTVRACALVLFWQVIVSIIKKNVR